MGRQIGISRPFESILFFLSSSDFLFLFDLLGSAKRVGLCQVTQDGWK